MENILIAEDEPHVSRLLKLALEKEGFNVTAVLNGLHALDSIKADVPDLLITDINMPKMDGETLCKTLSKSYPQREFPIVVLSSRTEVEHREWSQSIGNTMFLEKPVSIRKLLKYIHSIESE
ncbi:MAG: response regulator [Gammaproteobacteria bacterium]